MMLDRDAPGVGCNTSNGVATIELSNPGKRNAFTWAMYDQLESILKELRSDPSTRLVIIRGRDGSFASGTDIAQFAQFAGPEQGVAYERRVGRVLELLAEQPAPVVAAVDGPAVGAGLALAAYADIVIATHRSVFGAPIARTLGNCLPLAVVRRLQQRLGTARTMTMLLTSTLISAEVGSAGGLVSRLCDPTTFEDVVDEVVGQVLAGAPLTLAALKETDRRLHDVGQSDDDGADLLARCYGSADFREGVRAFLERRQPEWRGH